MTAYRGLRAATVALAFFALERPAAAQLVINEVDYDQPVTDTAEFIELLNTSADPVNLDTWSVALVNGGTTTAYETFDLPDVVLGAGEYYVLCGDAAIIPACNLDVTPDSNLIQNGEPDAIQLLDGLTAIDTVSYEGTVSGFAEGTGDDGEDDDPVQSISRFPDG